MSLVKEYFLEKHFQEVGYKEFYRDIFPVGTFENKGKYEDGKYNGIAVEIHNDKGGGQRTFRHIITDDLERIDSMVDRDNFCLMSPISYAGCHRTQKNARYLYALVIDLDGIKTKSNITVLMEQIEKGEKLKKIVWGLPKPTYLVSSGTGIHIYYVFKKPIPMYKSYINELEKLKRRLTWQAWTQGASTLHDHVQYEPLVQGFRVVGTITKDGKDRARAYRYGNCEKVTIDYLNDFVPEEDIYRASLKYKHSVGIDEAEKKYPEWYGQRIERKRPRKTWTCKTDLYEWWVRKVYGGATQGHRYWCVFVLAVYAKKCDVPFEKLKKDAMDMIPFMNTVGNGTDPFTKNDVNHALKGYSDDYLTYPIDVIQFHTDIKIKRNKRNGRKQVIHLAGARAVQKVNDEFNGTNWREGNGRKPKKNIVIEWRQNNPDGSKKQCKDDTGLTYPTIRKWWSAGDGKTDVTHESVAKYKKFHETKEKVKEQNSKTVTLTGEDGKKYEIPIEVLKKIAKDD